MIPSSNKIASAKANASLYQNRNTAHAIYFIDIGLSITPAYKFN